MARRGTRKVVLDPFDVESEAETELRLAVEAILKERAKPKLESAALIALRARVQVVNSESEAAGRLRGE